MAGSSSTKRSKHIYGILASVSTTELESIRVGIKRRNFTGSQSSAPIERGIGDPKSIVPLVHIGKDNKPVTRSIFDREGLVVNKEEKTIDIKKIEHSKSRSYSRSDSRSPYSRRRSRTRSRSRSPDRFVNKRRSTDRSRRRDRSSERKYRSRSSDRERSRNRSRRSTERDRSPKKYEKRRSTSRDRDNHRVRKKSITPLRPGEYRPNHPDLLKRRSREREGYVRIRSRRSKSPSADEPSTSRKRSLSSSRRISRSPQRSPKRRRSSRSPERYERKSRSTSPKHYRSAQYDRHSRRKSRSPRPNDCSPRARKRYSRSPDSDRDRRYRDRRRTRSRSPKSRDMPQFREPGLDFGYYEGIPTPDLWLHPHPGMIRGYIPRFYPPFYPRGIPPHGAQVMFPPRYPMVPNIIRGKLPIYNNRQKPKIVPAAEGDSTVSVFTSNVSQDETEGRCVIEEIKQGDVKTVEKPNDEPQQRNGHETENRSTTDVKTD